MRRLARSSFRPAERMRPRRIVRVDNEDGSSLYELALALPLLLALVVGIIFGGITFYDYVTLADAVAAGARTLATSRTSTNPLPCTAAEDMIRNSALNLNQTLLNVPTPAFTGQSACTVTANGVTTSGLKQGDTATVTATYPCDLKVPIVGFATIDICPAGDLLTSSTTVLIE